MCGINGFQGDFTENFLKEANNLISHRGPDHMDYVIHEKTGLGHVRLSIIDVSDKSNQPMTSGDGRYSIVFNGEIYNYQALKTELQDKGVCFNSDGDGEVLLECWAKYGVRCLEMLDGIFAFALFDHQTKELCLIRDQFGVKPLYYAQTPHGFLFSSELKVLLLDNRLSRELNINAIAKMATFLWSPGKETVLAEVLKVLPGEMLVIKDGKITDNKIYYTSPSYRGDLAQQESIEKLDQELSASVKAQLVSDVEVGAFLSGGLDSSLICAIAKKHNVDFKQVFSIDIDDEDNKKEGMEQDLPYAKKVAEDLGFDLNVVQASSEIIRDLPSAIFHLDEPQADPAILNAYLICKGAREEGIKVLLSGAGGDDLFTGYRRHYAVFLDRKLAAIPKFIRQFLAWASMGLPSTRPLFRRLKKILKALPLDENERLVEYFCWLDKQGLQNILRKDKFNSLTDLPREFLLRFIKSIKGNNVEKMLEIERAFFLVDHNFNYTDKMSMAHGVEVRVPFVSRKLIDIASRIPTKFKQKGKTGKWVLKKVAERWIRKDVIYRKKTGFGAPLRAWIHGPLKPVIEKLLSQEVIEKRGIFRYEAIKCMIEDDRNEKQDYAYTIYFLLTLEIWLIQFVDQPKPRKISFNELLSP